MPGSRESNSNRGDAAMEIMSDSDFASEFMELQAKYQQRVFAFILTLVPRWSDAEEILQETNTVLWEKREQFKIGTDFVHWANQIAYFKVLQFRDSRRRNVVCFSETSIGDIAAKSLSHSDMFRKQREVLEVCIQKLPEKDQTLISLRYLEGATVKTIAETTGRSLEAIYKALQRARVSLLACVRRNLVEEGQYE